MAEGARLTLLLVEDNEDDVLITRRALREVHDGSHRLDVARDGREALERLRAQCADDHRLLPDLVLLDVNMPRLDGFGVLREARRDEVLRTLPFVVLTTSAAEWDIRTAYELGANGYLVKPESYRDTVRMLEVVCAYWMMVRRRAGRAGEGGSA